MEPAPFHQLNYRFKCTKRHTKAEPLLPCHMLAHNGRISGCPFATPDCLSNSISQGNPQPPPHYSVHNLQWQHTLTISISAMLHTTARNHALSVHKHHLGSLSRSLTLTGFTPKYGRNMTTRSHTGRQPPSRHPIRCHRSYSAAMYHKLQSSPPATLWITRTSLECALQH